MYKFSIYPQDSTYGITNLELDDQLIGMPLDAMNGAQADDLRNRLIDALARVVLYTADIPAAAYDRWVRFFKNAHLIHAENVLLAWPCIADASDEEIQRIIAIARSFSIKVLFKLEAAHMEAFSLARYERLRSDATGLYYDPSEIVRLGRRPFHDVIYKCRVKDDIAFFRISEWTYPALEAQLPGQGQAQIKECSSNLLSRNYQGYFSFVPYGPDMQEAIHSFQEMLKRM